MDMKHFLQEQEHCMTMKKKMWLRKIHRLQKINYNRSVCGLYQWFGYQKPYTYYQPQ